KDVSRQELRSLATAGAVDVITQSGTNTLPINGRRKAGELRPSGTLQSPTQASFSNDAMAVQEPVVQVRTDFRSTIVWLPDVKTDADGTATVKVKYPDSLTTWSATARVVTSGNEFGIGN